MNDFDPIRFEVIRNAVLAATEEMTATLRRSAYSTNIKTRADFSCSLFDRHLRAAVQAFTQPVHLGSLVELVPRAVRTFGAERLEPGDMLVYQRPVCRRRPPQRLRELLNRKADDETGITGLRFHGYVAVVSLDNDPAYDVETESSAFAWLLGGKERIEDP